MSDTPYVLYGSHASYATAKSRSYLRKKGISFVERLPAAPRFREYVRPTSENHRIPQLEAPDGTVVQDTIAIFDFLEERFPEPRAYPSGPRQQLVCRLFEVLLDAALGRVAWHYRWNFMDENYGFVGREFGRSFKPQGSDAELDHYGRVIAERMEGKRAGMGDSRALRPVLDRIYHEVLAILEEHFTTQPYLFGGLPSIADHVLMGPLFGHLARDPEPSRIMKQVAPRVFRWTEHMNTPEIASPEFADAEPAYAADDALARDDHGAAAPLRRRRGARPGPQRRALRRLVRRARRPAAGLDRLARRLRRGNGRRLRGRAARRPGADGRLDLHALGAPARARLVPRAGRGRSQGRTRAAGVVRR